MDFYIKYIQMVFRSFVLEGGGEHFLKNAHSLLHHRGSKLRSNLKFNQLCRSGFPRRCSEDPLVAILLVEYAQLFCRNIIKLNIVFSVTLLSTPLSIGDSRDSLLGEMGAQRLS